MSIPIFSIAQENVFLREQIVDKIVTAAVCNDNSLTLEIGGEWVMAIQSLNLTWYRIDKRQDVLQ